MPSVDGARRDSNSAGNEDGGDVWPFAAWLKLAVARFGLTPAQFWQTSLHDWLTLIDVPQSPPLGRDDFARLQDAYPDYADPAQEAATQKDTL